MVQQLIKVNPGLNPCLTPKYQFNKGFSLRAEERVCAAWKHSPMRNGSIIMVPNCKVLKLATSSPAPIIYENLFLRCHQVPLYSKMWLSGPEVCKLYAWKPLEKNSMPISLHAPEFSHSKAEPPNGAFIAHVLIIQKRFSPISLQKSFPPQNKH